MKNVTGLVVSYNTKELLERAIISIKDNYPELKIIIIDGSEADNPCYEYVKNLNIYEVYGINMNHNIGHGRGLDYAIHKFVNTKYTAVFDSDILMNSRCLEKMIKACGDNYGAGHVVKINERGLRSPEGVRYLHPFFCIINTEQYKKYTGYVHHGSPFIRAAQDLAAKGQSHKLIDFPVANFVQHDWKGTRNLNPPEFLKGWE